MYENSIVEEPIVIFRNLKIEPDFTAISGEYILLDVSWNTSYQPLSKKLVKKSTFTLLNQHLINFHEMLKIHAENIILEYFISKGNKNYVYDYNKRGLEIQTHNTPNPDPGFVGSTIGINYIADDVMREIIYNESEEEKTIGNI